ncbi:MAG: rod shape-determining protein RodA [Chloroflexi bacterium]|nr:rod shape-determining protein RodA [Chloroflexota bacterium]
MSTTRTYHSVPFWRRFDWLLLLFILILMGLGLVMIYSSYEYAAPKEGRIWSDNLVIRQAIFGAIGLVLFVAVTIIDYRYIMTMSLVLIAGTVVMLGITYVLGHTSFGAQSWIRIQNLTLQPSELAKVIVILAGANVLGVPDERHDTLWPVILSAITVLPIVALIYLQPDAGTAMVLFITWVIMVFMSGIRWRYIAIAAGLSAVALPIIWFRLRQYQRDRILDFLYPSRAPLERRYNIIQALISVGSGGWWGKGLLNGTQSQLYFLRVRHTDFIFSVWAEEMGFVGAMVLIGIIVALISRCVRIGLRARDQKGRLIAVGVAAMIFIQSFINIGMNIELLPVTGLPLPLISYGGSSLVATLIALGLVENVALHSHAMEADLF